MGYFVKIVLYALVIIGAMLLTLPIYFFPPFYDVRYMGMAAIGGIAMIVLLPKILNGATRNADIKHKKKYIDLFRNFLAIAVTANMIGDLGLYQLYKVGFQYDKMIHFGISLLGVFAGTILLNNIGKIRLSYSVFIAVMIVLVCGVGWEIFERMSDFLFKTHIAGVYASDIDNDTKFDLLFDLVGALCGAGLVYRIIQKMGIDRAMKAVGFSSIMTI